MGWKLLLFLTVTLKQFNANQAADIGATLAASCKETGGKKTKEMFSQLNVSPCSLCSRGGGGWVACLWGQHAFGSSSNGNGEESLVLRHTTPSICHHNQERAHTHMHTQTHWHTKLETRMTHAQRRQTAAAFGSDTRRFSATLAA